MRIAWGKPRGCFSSSPGLCEKLPLRVMSATVLLASALSGAISRCVVHPLDTLRARLMVATAKQESLLSAARGIVSTDGLRGLYRGFGISVVMQAPAVATYLSTYDWSKPRTAQITGLSQQHPVVHLSSGLIAETVSAVFWVPMEVVKQRAQVRVGKSAVTSSFAVAVDLMRYEGPRALFKGYALTVGVFGPYSMFYFVAYEHLKSIWRRRLEVSEHHRLPTVAVASSASFAGAFAAALTCPLDIIKTRLQTQGDIMHGKELSRKNVVYTGTWHAAKSIAAEEGFRGFMRGISARVLWIMPGTAITMTSFEYLKSVFASRTNESVGHR